MKDFINLLTSGDYTTFIILSLIFVFVWLFKDMKKSLLEIKKSDLNFIDQSIESHAQALKTIHFFLNNSITENDLLDILYSSYKYFDKHILYIIDNFISSSRIISSEEKSALLTNLSKEIKAKINTLKDKQLHTTINKDYKFTALDFFNTASRNNFDIYCNALLYSSLILFISLIILDLILESYTLNRLNLIPLIAYILSSLFWLFSLSISIDLLFKKSYKKISLFIIFLILPPILTYCMNLCHDYIGKIILLILFILSVFVGLFINIKYLKEFYKK